MFHAPQAFLRQNNMGLGKKESSIVEFPSLGNCPWLAEYMHTKSSRPSRAKQSTELDCSCAHLSGAENQKTRICLHQRKIAGQRCPSMIMLEAASNINQRVLKHHPETTSSTSTSSNAFQGSSRQPSRASACHPNHHALTQHVAGCLPSRP